MVPESTRELHVPSLISRKREGGELRPHEIDALLDGYLAGRVPDYQMSALLMAICFGDLTDAELDVWTEQLIESGERWEWSGVSGPKVDKHSTGGVGDKVSLVLAPLAAALGLKVPMVSGRGLGHTGGTLDKLESIPGVRTDLATDDVRRLLGEVGFAMGGQTERFAPLDRELYALRDVTATVESVPLIAASILSKKAAEGLDALVLDVKTGVGAFLRDVDAARELARRMIALAGRLDLRAEVLLTSMEQPLGLTVGHALEVREAIAALRGKGPADLEEVTVALTARLLVLTGSQPTDDAARAACRAALRDGSALERLRRWIPLQGGDASVVDEPDRLPSAPARAGVRASRDGFVRAIDAREVGFLVLDLGGGRRRKGDAVDHRVGVVFRKKIGERVARGEELAVVHAADDAAAGEGARRLSKIVRIGEARREPPPLVQERIGG